MSDTDPLDLDAIETRAKAATPGPWSADGLAQCGPDDSLVIYPKEDAGAIAHVQPLWADAEFIAHARDDIPALVAEVRRLREEWAAHEEEGRYSW